MTVYNCKDIYKFYKASGGKLPYKSFKDIIAETNKKMSELVIKKGFEWVVSVGMIRVVRNKRTFKLNENGNLTGGINWKESNLLKQKFLDDNKILYECKKDDLGNIIWDNGGEKWLVYFVDEFYYLWSFTPDLLIHNGGWYLFTPTWTNSRNLIASITEDSELLYREKSGANKYDFVKNLTSKSRDDVRVEEQ